MGVGRGSLIFSPIFFDAFFAVYSARRLLGSKTWLSATLHRQGPRMGFEARNACFGITGACNRPIPTLLPSETCAQTPLDRPKMLFRRDPDFADAPETAQNGGFRAISPQRVFSRNPSHRPVVIDLNRRLRANIGCETWLRSRVASRPRGTFGALKGHIWSRQRTCWRARSPDRRAKPATGWFPSTQTTLDPGLVRLGRLGAVMATRVQNVQNGPKNVPFRLSPSVVWS